MSYLEYSYSLDKEGTPEEEQARAQARALARTPERAIARALARARARECKLINLKPIINISVKGSNIITQNTSVISVSSGK